MQSAESQDKKKKICVADKAIKPQILLEERTWEPIISMQVCFCGSLFFAGVALWRAKNGESQGFFYSLF